MKTYRRLLGISWKEKKTNEWVLQEVRRICGQELEGFVEIVKKRKLKLYGHEMRRGGLLKTVIEGSMEGGRGRPQRSWFTDVKEWTGEERKSRRWQKTWSNGGEKCMNGCTHGRYGHGLDDDDEGRQNNRHEDRHKDG